MNVAELKYELIRRGVREDSYRLGVGLPNANEQYCLVEQGKNWEIYYAEKGQKGFLEVFDNESVACERFLTRLERDESVFA